MAIETDDLHDLTKVSTPKAWVLFVLCLLAPLVVFFHPSFPEFALLMVVDSLSGLALPLWEERIFLRLYPEMRGYFPRFSASATELPDVRDRLRLFDMLAAFPRRRAAFVLIFSALKILPSAFVVICLFKYDHSWQLQAFKMLLWYLITATALAAQIFFDRHQAISSLIEQLHARHDWTETFRLVSFREPEHQFALVEALFLVSNMVYLVVCLCVVLADERSARPKLIVEVVVLTVTLLCAVLRVWWYSRTFHSRGLRTILRSLDGPQRTLPLQSTRVPGQFAQAVNALSDRIRAHERELSHWIFTRTEEDRLLALAEISALVVHDLSTPLQGVRLAADQANNERSRMQRPECIDNIVLNTARAMELVQSLRSYLRASAPPERGACVGEVYRYVMRILSTRFPEVHSGKVGAQLDPALEALVLEVTKADLIHVLMNLISNSLEDLLSHKVAAPTLALTLDALEAGSARISIRDNGSGLSAERFEELTGFALLTPSPSATPQSLGLRLVRRLVERQGGSLKVAPPEPGMNGTRFELELRRTGQAA